MNRTSISDAEVLLVQKSVAQLSVTIAEHCLAHNGGLVALLSCAIALLTAKQLDLLVELKDRAFAIDHLKSMQLRQLERFTKSPANWNWPKGVKPESLS